MGMAVIRYQIKGGQQVFWGECVENRVYPLATTSTSHTELMEEFFDDPVALKMKRSDTTGLMLDDIKLQSPIDNRVQLFCQGLNYAEHRSESGMSTLSAEQNLFMKASSSICGPQDPILRPHGCKLLDYEIELGLVLKSDITSATTITEATLPDYIGGLVLCNDVSARDIMFGAPMLQWFRGKSQRTFCPMGPILYLMEKEDFSLLYTLKLELKLNGEVRQAATTNELIHKPAPTLSNVSSFANMYAGDCLLTGTPGGVLAGSNLKVALSILANFKNDRKRREKFTEAQLSRQRFLEPGDVLELSIMSENGAIDLGKQHTIIADA